MEKIPSLIQNGEFDPAHQWVLEGKGTATQMWDGLCYALIQGLPYRHIVTGEITESVIISSIHEGQVWGWEPVPEDDALFWQAWQCYQPEGLYDWSCELVGPKVNGNAENLPSYALLYHGREVICSQQCPTLEGLSSYLAATNTEGLVWWENLWEPCCRKVKVQQSDFALKRRRK